MTSTLDAIGYKMDIPARMRYRFSHAIHDVSDAFTGKPGNGGEPGLIAIGEEKLSSMLHATQTGIAGVAGAAEERVEDVAQKVQAGLSDIKDNLVDTMTSASGATTMPADTTGAAATESMRNMALEAMETVKETAHTTWGSVGGFARKNSLALGLGAFAVGVLGGMFIPRDHKRSLATSRERRTRRARLL
jgi:hypothetical protein